jgi:glucose/mannose-6-phosphate isomerase
MNNLSDLNALKKLDPQDAFSSTEKMVEQLETAWNQVTALHILKFENIKNIVFCGMGASIYGALVIKSLLSREFSYPTEVVNDYNLPEWVDENTLVVLTSYSGTTEEILSCANEALADNSKMVVLTKGGPLAEFAKKNNIPAYIFDGSLNPANEPRLGCGYTILGLMGLLNKIGIITIEEHEIFNAILRLKEKFTDLKNQAITDSEIYVNKIPIIIAAEHLSGSAQILRNQFNETSKTFSSLYLVPDLNHHLMEGLQFPKNSPLYFILLNSENYSEKIQRRMELTTQVIKQNNHLIYEFMTSGQTLYDDFMEVLVYGSFLTLYLAYRYDQNPAINPWVDYFKAELKK